MNLARLSVIVASIGLLSSAYADSTTFTDTFDGTALNTSAWTASTPFSDSSVTVSGGNLVLDNRGGVLTTSGFTDPVDMLLSFEFTGNTDDSFRIGLRTDGTSTNPSAEYDSGIFASFRIQSDAGNTSGNVTLYDQNYPVSGSVLGTSTFAMTTDQPYLVRVLDTGSTISLFINSLVVPLLTVSDSNSYGDQIGIYNREGAGAGSGVSAGSQVSVDFFSVTSGSSVPDSGATVGLLGFSCLALAAFARRRLA